MVRQARGLSVAELAQRVGKSKSTVSRWERDEQGILWDDRLALARVLEVDLPVLFPDASSAYKHRVRERESA